MPHSSYAADRMGSAIVEPSGRFEAGSLASFTLTYTAGYFGIDDTGSIKIVHRFASDMGKPQFDQPDGWNYTTVEASNGAVLQVEYDGKRNIRPWDKTLFIRVVRGYLEEGDSIVVRFGDTRQGSPGMRVQTFSEPTFEFKVLVDAFATYNYTELEHSPTIAVVAGPPVAYKAILPSQAVAGEGVQPGFQGRGQMGQPSDRVSGEFTVRSSLPLRILPETFTCARASCRRGWKDWWQKRPGTCASRCCAAASPWRAAHAVPGRGGRQRNAPALLGRSARAVGGNDRHQFGRRPDPVRAGPRLSGRHEPPGQRLPDHHAVLGTAEQAYGAIQPGWVVRHLPGL